MTNIPYTSGNPSEPPDLTSLFRQLTSDNPNDRAWAVIELGALDDPRIAPALIAALRDDDADVQLEAIDAVSELRDPRAIPALFDIVNAPWSFSDDDGPQVHAYHALQLQPVLSREYLLHTIMDCDMAGWDRFGPYLYNHYLFLLSLNDLLPHDVKVECAGFNERIKQALLQTADDTRQMVRQYALAALGAIHNDSRVRERLFAGLRDRDADVCLAAARSLSHNDPSVDELAPYLADDEIRTRVAVVMAVSQCTAKNLDFLLLALDDPAPEVRLSALHAFIDHLWFELEDASDPAIRRVHARLSHCLRDDDPRVRVQVLQTFNKTNIPDRQQVFLAALRDADDAVRKAAIQALTSSDFLAVIDDLLRLLDDPNPKVRAAALDVSGGYPDQRKWVAALALIDHPDEEIRRQAAHGLSFSHDPRAYSALEGASHDISQDVAYEAIRSLISLAGEDSLDFLHAMLAHEWPGVRIYVIWRIGRLTNPQYIPLLKQALDDPFPSVRFWAIRVLRKIGDPRLFDEALLPLLDDKDQRVKREMIRAIAGTGNVRLLMAIIPLTRDKNREVRTEAIEALAQETGQDFGSNVTAWQRWFAK